MIRHCLLRRCLLSPSSLATFLLILSRSLCFLFPTERNSKLCISRFQEKVPNTAASGDGSSNGTFFRAVLLVRRGKCDEAREYVERARKCLATELVALMDTSDDFKSVFLEMLHREICVGQSLQIQG
ncbi:hypothetical protein C1H46_038696 [Malus baccata]|uniref:PIK-related kinase FAT domain-containing protein n=1 Tax=Malus baccata TaxID=106549 RepID=A0A540KNR5_MALBA|nr:hypothetical protein C1H46_038696 [Malus baccata]